MRDVLCVILGGGRGERLAPLTRYRSKPAIPFAGCYRLIDMPISNCLNSGMTQIFVLTQFNSRSLNRHISRTYKMANFTKGFVEILAAEQSMENTDWFQGTADAVRRCLKHFSDPKIEHIIILSGDQVYKMDLLDLLTYHRSHRADITVACNILPDGFDVSAFGIVGIDDTFKINRFVEKPLEASTIENLAVTIRGQKNHLASMGIYVFNKDVLFELLHSSDKADFGKEILPDAFSVKHTVAYLYDGYWRDVGTVRSLYAENLALTEEIPPLDLFNEDWQFYTRPRYLPPSKLQQCALEKTIVSEGVIVMDHCSIKHSILGIRSRIGKGTTIADSIIMGNDYYETLKEIEQVKKSGTPILGVGEHCHIRNAIIDKNVRIGNHVSILNKKKLDNFESEQYVIRDGITIILKNAVLPPHTMI